MVRSGRAGRHSFRVRAKEVVHRRAVRRVRLEARADQIDQERRLGVGSLGELRRLEMRVRARRQPRRRAVGRPPRRRLHEGLTRFLGACALAQWLPARQAARRQRARGGGGGGGSVGAARSGGSERLVYEGAHTGSRQLQARVVLVLVGGGGDPEGRRRREQRGEELRRRGVRR